LCENNSLTAVQHSSPVNLTLLDYTVQTYVAPAGAMIPFCVRRADCGLDSAQSGYSSP